MRLDLNVIWKYIGGYLQGKANLFFPKKNWPPLNSRSFDTVNEVAILSKCLTNLEKLRNNIRNFFVVDHLRF